MISLTLSLFHYIVVVNALIDHAHLIGHVPPIVQELSQEIHTDAMQLKYDKKRRSHKRHETVSILLRETFNKIRRVQKKTGKVLIIIVDILMVS